MMKMLFARTAAIFSILFIAATVRGQGTRADYERSSQLGQLTQHKVFNAQVMPHWTTDGNAFWYRNDLADGKREYIWVDAVAGKRGRAFDHEQVAISLGASQKARLDPDRLPIDSIDKGDKPGLLVLHSAGKRWELELSSCRVRPLLGEASKSGNSLQPIRRIHPSRTGEESSITFVNHMDGPIKLFWIDTDGKPQPYGTVAAGGSFEQNTYAGHVWRVTDDAGKPLGIFEAVAGGGEAIIDKNLANALPMPPRDRRPRTAPRTSARYETFIKQYNLYLRDTASDEETQLSNDGKPADFYESNVDWSPDGTKLVAYKTLDGDHRKVYVVQSSPPDQLQPKLESYDYLKPGDRIPLTKPHLFDVPTKKEIAISDELFPNPWELGDTRWSADSKSFSFFYNQRGHQVLRIISVDTATGKTAAIVDEQSKTFIDYAGKTFIRYLEKSPELIWMSERDGWNHLYLYDLKTNAVKNQITKGQWVVRKVDSVDEQHRQIYFEAGGIYPGQDPYYIHYCRVNFDGSDLVMLTQGNGTHKIDYSPDRRFLIDSYSRMDMAPVTELRSAMTGKLIVLLEKGDMTQLLASGWKTPELFVAKGRDKQTDIYGVIYRPSNFDPSKKYPVIEDIYAGPQDSFCPKAFSRSNNGMAMAELGFVVVQIDGMGTSNRSKAFHDVCWRNLGDAGFPDRILWMKAAAVDRPWMDLSRVGIYGTSAGGQDALRAVEAFGNFYTAAVADCGCHDNRMDKIWWNELWMGWPIGPWYAEQSNVTNAKDLHGALLLIVGETDHNVDPASTMQVVNALIKADKDFELLVIPNADHGQDGEYGNRRRKDFFVRHLLGVEPRAR